MKNWLHSAYDNNPRGTKDIFGSFETDLFRFIKPTDCYIDNEVELYPTKTFNLFKQGQHWKGGWKHAFNNYTNSTFNNEGFVTDYECLKPGQEGKFVLGITKELPANFKRILYDNEISALNQKISRKTDERARRRAEIELVIVKNGKKNAERFYSSSPLIMMFDEINIQIKKHINRELNFFNKYKDAEGANEIIDAYTNLQKLAVNLSKRH